MRLTAIELENFKGIGRRQKIELKPITLLFGPNSAGKSMIIQSLHYLRGILSDGELDPQSFLGGRVDLGGFRQLIHRHELGRTVRISVRAEDMGFEDASWLGRERLEDLGFTARFEQTTVGLSVAWSATVGGPYISRLEIALDNRPFAAIEALPDGRRVEIIELNFGHPMLASEELSVEAVLSAANALAAGSPLPLGLDPDRTVGAMPRIGRPLGIVLDADPERETDADPDEETEAEQVKAVLQLISFGVAVPLAALERELRRVLHVGPYRLIPSRAFVPHVSLQTRPEDWYSGIAAYGFLAETARRLQEESTQTVATINDWLDDGALNTGYRLDLKRIREIPADHWLIGALEDGDVLDMAEAVPEIIRSLPERVRIVVTDRRTGTELSPADVGVGFSQVVPIIAAAIRGGSIVAIEQPELHLHPAQQVALGDLFLYMAFDPGEGDWGLGSINRQLASAWGQTFLIETHSEHLILRFLRRIRETFSHKAGFQGPILKPDEISVYWIEPGADGASVRRLRIDEDGDFTDPWPRGFFEEREDELF